MFSRGLSKRGSQHKSNKKPVHHTRAAQGRRQKKKVEKMKFALLHKAPRGSAIMNRYNYQQHTLTTWPPTFANKNADKGLGSVTHSNYGDWGRWKKGVFLSRPMSKHYLQAHTNFRVSKRLRRGGDAGNVHAPQKTSLSC